MFSPAKVREDFHILEEGWIYLDNAATTQKPDSVIDAIRHYYLKQNANVHRSNYELAEVATQVFESSRRTIANYIGSEPQELIFTRGTTESINLVAYSLFVGGFFKEGDKIAVTLAEHHSNFVPWQQLARRFKAEVVFVDTDDEGRIKLSEVEKALDKGVKLLAFTGMSNSLGVITPYREICSLARERNVLTLLDGAQLVPHHRIDVKELECDFLAFSAHKMLGPTGIGALYARKELLETMTPFLYGGEMIDEVTLEDTTFNVLPYKFEAGTPNIAGAVGFAEAVRYLAKLDWEEVQSHIKRLTDALLDELKSLPYVEIYGPKDESQHSIVSFNVKGLHPHDVAQYLSAWKIAVRSGHHCAQPQLKRIGVPATCRASIYIYNVDEDIIRMKKALENIKSEFPWVG